MEVVVRNVRSIVCFLCVVVVFLQCALYLLFRKWLLLSS